MHVLLRSLNDCRKLLYKRLVLEVPESEEVDRFIRKISNAKRPSWNLKSLVLQIVWMLMHGTKFRQNWISNKVGDIFEVFVINGVFANYFQNSPDYREAIYGMVIRWKKLRITILIYFCKGRVCSWRKAYLNLNSWILQNFWKIVFQDELYIYCEQVPPKHYVLRYDCKVEFMPSMDYMKSSPALPSQKVLHPWLHQPNVSYQISCSTWKGPCLPEIKYPAGFCNTFVSGSLTSFQEGWTMSVVLDTFYIFLKCERKVCWRYWKQWDYWQRRKSWNEALTRDRKQKLLPYKKSLSILKVVW